MTQSANDDTALIFICGTCDRSQAGANIGAALAAALQSRLLASGAPLQLRQVACLNGCRRPCNAAFRGRDRWTYRFSECGERDLNELIAFGTHYWQAAQGLVLEQAMSPTLRAKLSACTPPPA